MVVSFDIWWWTERLSWLFGVLGLPVALFFGYVQLKDIAKTQVRIADELTARSKVRIGFMRADGPADLTEETEVFAEWVDNADLSKPIDLPLMTYNYGNRTAKGLLWNFTFPILVTSMEEQGGNYYRDPHGHLLIITDCNSINPSSGIPIILRNVCLPKDQRVLLKVTLTLEDVPMKKFELAVSSRNYR